MSIDKQKSLIVKKLDKFFSTYRRISFKKGEIIIRADDPPAGIFYLKEGVVREYVISQKGEELTLNIFRPYAFFPMSYAINKTINNHFYEAQTQVLTWRAPVEDILQFIKNEPEVMFDLLARIYIGLQGIFARMEYLMTGSAKTRLITELLIYAKRFGDKKTGKITVDLRLTQKDLSSQSGIARETVGRIIKTLKSKKLIAFQNKKLIINDLRGLEEELV